MKGSETIYVCEICGETAESGNADGWRVQSLERNDGQMLVRCPKHYDAGLTYYDRWPEHNPNRVKHTALVADGKVITAWIWQPGGDWRGRDVLPDLFGLAVEDLHERGFRKRSEPR